MQTTLREGRELLPQPDIAREFLAGLGQVHLVAINGGTVGRDFGDDVEAALAWASSQNTRQSNVYWTVNAVKPGVHKKPRKEDIESARYVHCDIDPVAGIEFDADATLDRLQRMDCPPSFVVHSGNGLQALWRLDDPAENWQFIEAINRGVRDALRDGGGDHCWNADRLFRVPGYINWPNAKKALAGRVPALATIMQADDGVVYSPSELAAAFPERPAEKAELPLPVSPDFDWPAQIAADLSLQHDIIGPCPDRYNSDRSAWGMGIARILHSNGVSEANARRILLSPLLGCSAHFLAQPDPSRAVDRVLAKAFSSDAKAAAPISEIELHYASEWDGDPVPVRRWALTHWIPDGQVTLLAGRGSAGKSLLSQQLVTSLALGLPFFGIETAQRNCLYVSCEDDLDELHRRQCDIMAASNSPLASLGQSLGIISLHGEIGNELASFDRTGKIAVGTRFNQILQLAKDSQTRLVILDNASHFFGGDENNRPQVTAFLNLCNQLAREIDGSVVLLHHTAKMVGSSYSGSTGWENNVRARILLEVPQEADGSVIDPDLRRLSLGKANYGRNGAEIRFRWHKGAFIDPNALPKDVGAELAETIRATGDNAIFLECLRERISQKRAVSEKRGPTYAPTEFAKMPQSKGIGKARLEKGMERLFQTRSIERTELWKGSDRKPVFGLRETCG